MTIRVHRVPNRGDTPTEEMIEWLNRCPVDWDGDDEGVSIEVRPGHRVIAAPGDYICQHQGQWFVLTAAALESLGRLTR